MQTVSIHVTVWLTVPHRGSGSREASSMPVLGTFTHTVLEDWTVHTGAM